MEIISKWCKEEKQTFSYFPIIGVYPHNSPLGRMYLLEKGDFLSSPVEPFRWAWRKSGLRSWKKVGFKGFLLLYTKMRMKYVLDSLKLQICT